jgi:hypothetical protein
MSDFFFDPSDRKPATEQCNWCNSPAQIRIAVRSSNSSEWSKPIGVDYYCTTCKALEERTGKLYAIVGLVWVGLLVILGIVVKLQEDASDSVLGTSMVLAIASGYLIVLIVHITLLRRQLARHTKGITTTIVLAVLAMLFWPIVAPFVVLSKWQTIVKKR